MIWSDFIELYVKWSGYFPFLIINGGLKLHGTDEFICGAICIGGLSHFINQITTLGICMLNDYKSTARNSAQSVGYSIHTLHSLLFDHETIIVI